MKSKFFLFLIVLVANSVLGQEMTSKADKYFYSYAYEDAIREYQKQMQEGKLITNYQLLNLADSYFKTGDYVKASKIYLDINKNDTIMSSNRFNQMLQSLSRTSDTERVKALFESKSNVLASELIENVEFNYRLLEEDTDLSSGFFVFSVNGNSEYADFSPSFYNDKLLFSSARKSKSKKTYGSSGESYLDIYVADRKNSGAIANARSFEGIPDSPYHKSTPFYLASSGAIYYILSNTEGKNLAFDEKGKNALAIGMAYDNGFFRFILKDLSTSFYYPYFDEKTERLYFSANFEDSYGGTDLYYVLTNNGQVMSEPINLGPRINTSGNEIAPYLFDNTLYFSSDVFYGLGGMDIYRSKVQRNGSFSIPVNLGKGINTKYDEFGFIISQEEDGFLGYFSSNRPGGRGHDDIYGFKVDEKPGLRTLIFAGEVTASRYDTPTKDVRIELTDVNGELLKETYTNEDGFYQMEIPYTDIVTLAVTKNGYSTFTETYNPKGLSELQKAPLNVNLVAIEDMVRKKEGKTVLELNNFFFATGKTNVTPDIAAELDKVVDAVNKFPQIRLGIETYTDSRGASSSNKRLSQKRAEAIKMYLVQNGVPEKNISYTEGFGEEKIINNCTDGVYCLDFLHKQNLRTLFVVENYENMAQGAN
ncbi:OmpA family protein [Pareuzebyella sediminis]|uniref:OmpA family protein n=1 Tax=Pareuzebyella sediminis TaxID=2607998 RepID=UPI0011EDB0DC|nr:OmpA family protein [Pareuzebyella sediminis]